MESFLNTSHHLYRYRGEYLSLVTEFVSSALVQMKIFISIPETIIIDVLTIILSL